MELNLQPHVKYCPNSARKPTMISHSSALGYNGPGDAVEGTNASRESENVQVHKPESVRGKSLAGKHTGILQRPWKPCL